MAGVMEAFLAARQQAAQQQNQQLGMLAQLAQLQGASADREMKAQLMPLQIQREKGALEKLAAEAQQAKEKAAFFSPENQQQFMSEPGKLNFDRLLETAAARGFVNPEVYANHKAQQEQRKADAEQRTQIAREAIESKAEIARQRSEDQRLTAAERNQARMDMIRLAASLRQPPQPVAPTIVQTDSGPMVLPRGSNQAVPILGSDGQPVRGKATEKAMPASAIKTLMENQQNLRRAEQALALVQGKSTGTAVGDTQATGWKGLLSTTEIGDQALQRLDPKGVDTRAAISDLGSMIIHDRSGAAVTAAEYPRLRPFIPKVTDNADTARKKLERFVTEYRNVQQEAVDFFKESGYKVPTESLRPPASSGTSGQWEVVK